MPAPKSRSLDPMPLKRRLRRMMKRVRRTLQVVGAEGGLFLSRRLPRPAARALGRVVGGICHALMASQRRSALEHIRLALGDTHSEAERQAIVRATFRHFFETLLDVLVMSRWGAEEARKRVSIEGWERAAVLVDRERERTGTGVIIMTGHFGCWDLIGMLAWLEWRHDALYISRRYKVSGYNRLLEKIRRGIAGCDVIYQDETPRRALVHLRKGGIIGMLADVDAKRIAGAFIDFFGRPAYTPIAPAALSIKLGVSLVPVYVVRSGRGYRVISHDPIDPRQVEGSEDPVRELTQLWSRVLENDIRRFPEQWIWSHDRWRTTSEILARRQEQQRVREERQRAPDPEASSSHLPPSPRAS